MDAFVCRSISFAILFIGSGLVALGTLGTWYFGNQVEKIFPYRQPINTASATVEIFVDSDEKINTHVLDRGGYLILANSQEKLLDVNSEDSHIMQMGNGRVLYKGYFHMDSNDPTVGKPVNYLANAEYAQIFFFRIPEGKKVLGGKAVCNINNNVRFEIIIPEQMPTKIKENEGEKRPDTYLIFAKDIKDAFLKFEKQ